MRISIIGCGFIGQKRAAAGHDVAVACDPDPVRRHALAEATGARAEADWRKAIEVDTDVVVVATPHDQLATIALAAIDAGRHLLIEKPAGRNPAEARRVAQAARARGVVVKVGFNHRFHPAMIKAHRLVAEGAIGPLLYIRGRYGHGGRIGYEKEWRFVREISGGGELIDQGSHLIDLSRWFMGELELAYGYAPRLFWPGQVDDNAFLALRHASGAIAWLHASWTEWKNQFSFEIMGRDGKLTIDGLGGSYGSGETHLPPHAAADGPAGNHRLGVRLSRPILLRRIRESRRRHSGRGQGDRRYRRRGGEPRHHPVGLRPGSLMIIVRSPLRITLGGGGTDLPSYYANHEGFLIAAAIDKYVYVTVIKPFTPGIYLKYSEIEHVDSVDDVKHRIIRESLKLFEAEASQIEITTLADIPAGTGLGSSGSFTTALLRALHAQARNIIHPRELAEQACHIEIDILGEPIGKQDQYIAAFGGITCFTFRRDGIVDAAPLNIREDTRNILSENLVMFFTGFSRSASSLLQDQDARTRQNDTAMIDNLHYVKDLGLRSKAALETGDLIGFGRLMHEHWEHKRKRSRGMSNPLIDSWYELATRNGAVGGKLIGAGGGGFLMFYAEEKVRLRQAMREAGLTEVRYHFDFEGTKIVAN